MIKEVLWLLKTKMGRKEETEGFFVSILLSCSFAVLAKADFRVCNSTQQSVGVALGYRTLSGWVSEGWWVVPETGCKTLIEGPLFSRFYYFYAEAAQKKVIGRVL